ncbi:hypothetical protein BT93_G1001 [Corymbia citriodora subsp. variegata]|nr:hypothetical protein BT93_G1001 [Corymbia citriodora subsp. variegata]
MALSMHICDGRRLTDMDKKLAKRTTSSSKSMPRNNSFNNEGNDAETPVAEKPENAIVQTRTTQKLMTMRKATKEKIRGPSHDHQDMSSLISDSWLDPRKIPTEKHPGLDSDYSPPKTHPPSHN